MAEVIRMPRMSDTMTEGVIVAWHKKVGDTVKSGDLLAEVETDKATMELESYNNGVLLHIGVEEGAAVPVNGILAIIGNAGESFENILLATNTVLDVDKKAAINTEINIAENNTNTQPSSTIAISSTNETRIKASPLAKKIAKDKGIALTTIKGSGDGGRIVKKDLENINGVGSSSSFIPSFIPTGQESYNDTSVPQMRKTIARRLGESKFTAPHFYLTMSINMDNAKALRTSLNELAPIKVSYNDLILKACAMALLKNPKINSSWLGDKIRTNHHVHIGMAVSVDEGLLVPVVRFAHEKSVLQIAKETKSLAERAKNKQLQPSDWEGNTFTISNLGMFDIDEFTAIINTPDACILAVGSIKEEAISIDGVIKSANIMKVTLSCDHRVVDGVAGAQFLQDLKKILENPVALFI